MCNPMEGFPHCSPGDAVDYLTGRRTAPWLEPQKDNAKKADLPKAKPPKAEPERDMGPNPGIPAGMPRIIADMSAMLRPLYMSVFDAEFAGHGRPDQGPATQSTTKPGDRERGASAPAPSERPTEPVEVAPQPALGNPSMGHMDFRTSLARHVEDGDLDGAGRSTPEGRLLSEPGPQSTPAESGDAVDRRRGFKPPDRLGELNTTGKGGFGPLSGGPGIYCRVADLSMDDTGTLSTEAQYLTMNQRLASKPIHIDAGTVAVAGVLIVVLAIALAPETGGASLVPLTAL